MQDPKGYQEINNMQSRDLEVILKECPIKWKHNARIIDIGCGDGSVTVDLWKKYIPECFVTIIGSDKSQTCVDFAKKKYESERVKFITLDIEGDVPWELNGCFDHVVSNYTLHWAQRQEKTFSNIYDMLTEDGNCLLLFVGNCKIYDYCRKLSRSAKWSADLKDVETKLITPYQDSQDVENEIRSLMRKIGFQNINIQVKNQHTFDFLHGIDGLKDFLKCLNPFDGLKDKWDEFMDDYIKLDPNAGTIVYQLLVVSGTK